MGSAVETANMEGGRYLILAVVGIALLSSAYANPRKIREADDEAVTVASTTASTTSNTTETVVDEKIIESDTSDNEIDDATEMEEHDENTDHEEHDNDKNCHKCHKASFKYRKDLFCDKCIKKGLVNLEKDVGKKLHCKKCKKSKFRNKNGDFCKIKCPDQMKEEEGVIENETTTEVAEEATEEKFKLGPLGSLLKFFVVSNTWGQAEPSSEVEE